MHCSVLLATISLSAGLVLGLPKESRATYVDWKTYKGNGVNLGGWLLQESFIDSAFWKEYAGDAPDEWTMCQNLGSRCGSVLERRYATYITPQDIDQLATVGVNVLRIPIHYAAWVKVPGSQLYSGNQVSHLDRIARYAATKYQMHSIIDIHSLPGGVNGMGLGEKDGNWNWFNNATALDYSLQAVSAALDYIKSSGMPGSFSLAPINEPVDSRDLSKFGTPASLSDQGFNWVLSYINAVIQLAEQKSPGTPIMFQGGFRPVTEWSAQLPAGANLCFDVHNYYFAGRNVTSKNMQEFMTIDAGRSVDSQRRFPTFIGEWSIQAELNNTFASRKANFNFGRKLWATATQGSAYWTIKNTGLAPVSGEGVQGDYWSYETFIKGGYFN
jgi:aryl-phospho-beta-D-glucosidase BglC (GH1 family)